jgi:hypothetical protein
LLHTVCSVRKWGIKAALMGLLNTVLDIDILECAPDGFSPERIILQVIDFVTEIFGVISNIQNGAFHHANTLNGGEVSGFSTILRPSLSYK